MSRKLAGALIALSLSLPLHAFAGDTPAEREMAVDRYLKTVPMQKVMDEMLLGMAKSIPPEKREQFMKDMHSIIRIDVMTDISRRGMVKTFTAAELNALADFYASPAGSSAMRKLGPYMAEVMPELLGELKRSINELKAREQKASSKSAS